LAGSSNIEVLLLLSDISISFDFFIQCGKLSPSSGPLLSTSITGQYNKLSNFAPCFLVVGGVPGKRHERAKRALRLRSCMAQPSSRRAFDPVKKSGNINKEGRTRPVGQPVTEL
jgi:hypothetical protein